MAEHTDQESSDNLPNTELENSNSDFIPAADLENNTSNQKAANMEVHHHPDLHHKPKKWKEYLLEFLMIFLAVTLGFFAESLREHISEKRIEKEYIESFVADLKADIERFKVIIPIEENSINGLDTLLNTIADRPFNDSSTRMMYYLSRKYTMSIEPMSYSLGTITQLRNSGGLRLISNKTASDSIISYNKTVDDIMSVLNFAEHDFIIPSIRVGNKIFNSKYFLRYNGETIISLLSSSEKAELLTKDESVVNEYTNFIYQVKQIRMNYLEQLKRHEQRANIMTSFFKKEYHLE
jgi:hypothetical protein